MKFEGRVCVITGGALGIGRCIAESFARKGAALHLSTGMNAPAGKHWNG